MPKRSSKASVIRIAPHCRTLGPNSPVSTTSPSEAQHNAEATTPSIASLTLDTPLVPLTRRMKKAAAKPFPFLSLPSELRVKIYQNYFEGTDAVLDLGPDNYKRVHKLLGLMRVCKQIHSEATHQFYSTHIFRLFPIYPGRYFKSKKPLLARMRSSQRSCITAVELRLGPGWNAPPRGWIVNHALGLKDCVAVNRLCVFVECDPSDGAFKGFRRAEGFYEAFSRSLLKDVMDSLPQVQVVEFDAWSSVNMSGAMMRGLIDVVSQFRCQIQWGPRRGWRCDKVTMSMSNPLNQFQMSRPCLPSHKS